MKIFRAAVLAVGLSLLLSEGSAAGVFSKPVGSQRSPRWSRGVLVVSVSDSLFQGQAVKPGSDVSGAVEGAAREWSRATGLTIRVVWNDSLPASQSVGRLDRRNLITIEPVAENLLMFAGDGASNPSKTRTFSNSRNQIVEADIVLNPYLQFSTDGTPGTFDLQAVLTHEFGHMLGLGHSPVVGATMHGYIGRNGEGGASQFHYRTLAASDVNVASELYQPVGGRVGEGLIRVSLSGADPAVSRAVWIEEASTGRVVSGKYQSGEGAVEFSNLPPGAYFVRVQAVAGDSPEAASELPWVRRIEIAPGHDGHLLETGAIPRGRALTALSAGPSSDFLPIPVSLGGERGFHGMLLSEGAESLAGSVWSTSPLFSVETRFSEGLGRGETVHGFSLFHEGFLPDGEYTLALRGRDGAASYLIGLLSVERVRGAFERYPRD